MGCARRDDDAGGESSLSPRGKKADQVANRCYPSVLVLVIWLDRIPSSDEQDQEWTLKFGACTRDSREGEGINGARLLLLILQARTLLNECG